MVKGQMAAQDEHSSETCLRDEINDVVQKAGQEKADPVALAAFLEEAGTWYYVVDCATLRAITVVFIFLRASVFSVQTSSFVHGRSFNVFFAIAVTHALTLSTNQPAIVIN